MFFLPNILVIDAKRTCLPNYLQDFSRYAYGNAAIAMLDKFLVTGHTTEVRSGLLYHGIITGGYNKWKIPVYGVQTQERERNCKEQSFFA